MITPERRYPRRGEIWWVQFPGDRAGKKRPAVIVSVDSRNANPRADTVLAIPLSTSIQKLGPFHLLLRSGETGLRDDSVVWADNISVITREQLAGPVSGHRAVTHTQICRLAALVKLAMGCVE
jgi:mRNA-degrading endonuclease toxin of MazEF toxin-antitoxin module